VAVFHFIFGFVSYSLNDTQSSTTATNVVSKQGHKKRPYHFTLSEINSIGRSLVTGVRYSYPRYSVYSQHHNKR